MTTKPLFLDTTIQVDRVIKEQPPGLLAAFNSLLAGHFSLIPTTFRRNL